MMDYSFWVAAIVYVVFSMLLLRMLWIAASRLQSRLLRATMLWTLLVVLFFPWFSDTLEGHFAPSIIVAAFAWLDTNPMQAVEVMQWQAMAWVTGWLVLWVVLKFFPLQASVSDADE